MKSRKREIRGKRRKRKTRRGGIKLRHSSDLGIWNILKKNWVLYKTKYPLRDSPTSWVLGIPVSEGTKVAIGKIPVVGKFSEVTVQGSKILTIDVLYKNEKYTVWGGDESWFRARLMSAADLRKVETDKGKRMLLLKRVREIIRTWRDWMPIMAAEGRKATRETK